MGQYRHSSLALIRVDPAAVLCQNSVAPRVDTIILRVSCRRVQERHEIVHSSGCGAGDGHGIAPIADRFAPVQIPHRWTRVRDPGAEAVVAAYDTVIAGGGPAGLDGRVRADPPWPFLRRARGRSPDGRRHQPDRRVQGIPVRHRRPPVLLQERRDQRPLARDPGRPVHHPLAALAASTTTASSSIIRSNQWTPSGSSAPGVPRRSSLSYLKARLRPIRPERSLRGLGRQPLRPRALRDLLQVLHREGLGYAHERDLCRLGGAADQGAEPDQRRRQRPAGRTQVAARAR